MPGPLIRSFLLVAVVAPLAVAAAGCGPILHTEMLGESIRSFSSHGWKGTEKVWVTSQHDSGCDRVAGAKTEGSKLSFFSRGSGSEGPYDKLAFEVFSNYLTQRKKARVVESHRHNYATELNPETHRKADLTLEGGHGTVATTSAEDLCLLDEAKKRKADKVLVYHIIEMENDKMWIHLRLSDVTTGVVDQSQSMRIVNLRAQDFSYGGGGRARSTGED
jgi:hypothetical protein